MADELIYFGRPGSLITIPWPRGGIQSTRERQVDVFNLDSGGVRTGKLLGGKRTYRLAYNSLDYTTFALLEAFDQGHQGPGPFVLLDPGRRNTLTPNQSAATSETNGTDNYTVAGTGGSISSSSTTGTFSRGPRSLKWSFTITTPATATLTLDSPSPDWYGVPVAIRPYIFSFKALGAGSDAIVTLTAQILWLDITGATLSTTSGSGVATNAATFTTYTVTATAPANTAFALCRVSATGSTVSNGTILYLDELQFEEGAAATAWTPGTGILPLEVISLDDGMQHRWFDFRDGPVFVVREVGP